ncbi:MAG: hypothetical protein K0S10_3258 [Rubrobacteraceae bacterium]|nr:hypothetical protein [Rubrobacteraceae bacterium]
MADREVRSILVGTMVIDAHIERHPFTCCLRGRRSAIEGLGTGWSLLTFLPNFPFTEATLIIRPCPTDARGVLS